MRYAQLFASCTFAVSITAQVTHHVPAAAALVDAGAKVEKLGGGMQFTEGPVWLPEEQALVSSDGDRHTPLGMSNSR